MKKNAALFLFTFFTISFVSAQQSRYHRLRSLGTDLDSSEKNTFCAGGNFNNKPLAKWNVISLNPLNVGEIYLIFIDDELKYYWVEQTFSYPTDDDGETVSEANITLMNISCPAPDLEAVQVSVSTSTINHGENKTVNYNVKNIGNLTATSTRFEFYLSSTTTNFMELLESKSVGNVNVNQTITGSTTVKIPSGTNTDTYKIALKVSTNGESNLSNNTTYSSSSFMVNGVQDYPDLIIDTNGSTARSSGGGSTQSFSTNTFHSLYLGESLQLQIKVKNDGEINSNTMKVGIYITSGSEFSNATLLKELNYSGIINPNDSKSQSTEVSKSNIDSYADSNGRAYIHIVVDNKNNVNEGSSGGEDNNRFSSIPVISHNSNRTSKIAIKKSNITVEENNSDRYYIDIYNFTGILVKSLKVNSIEQENNIINSLSSGLYIIKTPTQIRKISK
ncbi:CARDB domain-containing protein [Flavivirga abyssicola]|uniref:CARDB domain-containing protein n=1 Tax=Flavivirga abyssicola TaxID=3063533 RepID=UPI0026DF56CB|nr:CARDB domain-containing protein [Flavivirga sp. MEBiC07777]WVK15194.1 CARDB domain-containing protein [Flavivirga sp. MEBiC07777]